MGLHTTPRTSAALIVSSRPAQTVADAFVDVLLLLLLLLLLLQMGTMVISTCTSCKKAFLLAAECLDRCPTGLSQYGLHSNFGRRWYVQPRALSAYLPVRVVRTFCP